MAKSHIKLFDVFQAGFLALEQCDVVLYSLMQLNSTVSDLNVFSLVASIREGPSSERLAKTRRPYRP